MKKKNIQSPLYHHFSTILSDAKQSSHPFVSSDPKGQAASASSKLLLAAVKAKVILSGREPSELSGDWLKGKESASKR